jgi:hypothetical protein
MFRISLFANMNAHMLYIYEFVVGARKERDLQDCHYYPILAQGDGSHDPKTAVFSIMARRGS